MYPAANWNVCGSPIGRIQRYIRRARRLPCLEMDRLHRDADGSRVAIARRLALQALRNEVRYSVT